MTCRFFVPIAFRDFFFDFMVSQSNKMIYDAQKFIKTLLKVLSNEDHSGWKFLLSKFFVFAYGDKNDPGREVLLHVRLDLQMHV